ncbi:MAG: hypothetical protein LBD80_08900 [Tannerella sp.]|jgi:hypothetical protein|nr:hypothetical protein [Tannerella sp.]
MDKFCRLTEKYFEGQTSLEEEQLLRNYYRRKKITPELELYKPVFNYFNEERDILKSKKLHTSKVFFRITAIAAACALLVFTLKMNDLLQSSGNELKSLAYIDAQKITDIEIIGIEMLNSLENLSEENDKIYALQVRALEIFTEEEPNK